MYSSIYKSDISLGKAMFFILSQMNSAVLY